MPVFLCRWENGDFSIVKAANKEQAIEFLDEVGNAENQPITALTDFMVHFVLTDDGDFELQSYGEETYEHVMRLGYPVLDKAHLNAATDETGAVTAEGQETIRQAVKKERERVSPRRAKSPKTQLGSKIKAQMDLPTKRVDRIVEERGLEVLKKFKGKGKTN